MKNRKNHSFFNITLLLIFIFSFLVSCQPSHQEQNEHKSDTISTTTHSNVKRVGMVIKIKPEMLDSYKALHADSAKGVRDLLTKYNLRNFSIFMTQLDDGNYYEFGYYEYWGDDFEADMKKLNAEPRNKAWLELCDPMQIPVADAISWKEMERIYFNY